MKEHTMSDLDALKVQRDEYVENLKQVDEALEGLTKKINEYATARQQLLGAIQALDKSIDLLSPDTVDNGDGPGIDGGPSKVPPGPVS